MRHGSSIMIPKQSSSRVSGNRMIHPLQGRRKDVQVHVKTHVHSVLRHKRSNFESCRTKRTASQFNVLFTHPPYSPALAPCDFALFPKLKDELKGKHFNDLDELRSESTRILYSYPVEWFDQVYRQWIERHRKCIASQCAYFEKN